MLQSSLPNPMPNPISPSAQLDFDKHLEILTRRSAFLIVEKKEGESIISSTRNIFKVLQQAWEDFRDRQSMRNDTCLEAATIAYLQKNKGLINDTNAGKVKQLAARLGCVQDSKKEMNHHQQLGEIINLISRNTFANATKNYLEDFLNEQKPEFMSIYFDVANHLPGRVKLASNEEMLTSLSRHVGIEAGPNPAPLTGRVALDSVPSSVKKKETKSKEEVLQHLGAISNALKNNNLLPEVKQVLEKSRRICSEMHNSGTIPDFNEDLEIAWRMDNFLLNNGLEAQSFDKALSFVSELRFNGKGILDQDIDQVIRQCEELGNKRDLPPAVRAQVKVSGLLLTGYKNQFNGIKEQATLLPPEYSSGMPGHLHLENYLNWVQKIQVGRMAASLKCSTIQELLEASNKTQNFFNKVEEELQVARESLQRVSRTKTSARSPDLSSRQFMEKYIDWLYGGHLERIAELLQTLTAQESFNQSEKIMELIAQTDKEFAAVRESCEVASPILLEMMASTIRDRKGLTPKDCEELILTLFSGNYPTEKVQECLSAVLDGAQKIWDRKGISEKPIEELTSEEFAAHLKRNKKEMEQWAPQARIIVNLASVLMAQSKQILAEHKSDFEKESFSQDSCQDLVFMLDYVENKVALQQRDMEIQNKEKQLEMRLEGMRQQVEKWKPTDPLLGRLMERRIEHYLQGVQDLADPAESFIKSLKGESDGGENIDLVDQTQAKEADMLGKEDLAFKQRKDKLQKLAENLEDRLVQMTSLERMLKQLEELNAQHQNLRQYENTLRVIKYMPELSDNDSQQRIKETTRMLAGLKTSMPIAGWLGTSQLPIDQLEFENATTPPSAQNTLEAYQKRLAKALQNVKALLNLTFIRTLIDQVSVGPETQISPHLQQEIKNLYGHLAKLVKLADQNGALRAALGKWRKEKSDDNQDLNDFLADGIPRVLGDEEILAHFTKFLELVKKGLESSGQFQKDADGNLVSQTEGLDKAYKDMLRVYNSVSNKMIQKEQ